MVDLNIDLVPDVKRAKTRFSDSDKAVDEADDAFADARLSVIKRDRWTCQGCGFRSESQHARSSEGFDSETPRDDEDVEFTAGYLEVHHRDHDHSNNSTTNLVTLCPFCHKVYHIGYATGRNRQLNELFTIVYMDPDLELSQVELNGMMHQIFIAMENNDGIVHEGARYMYDEIRGMKHRLETIDIELRKSDRLDGTGYSELSRNPTILGGALYNLYQESPGTYEQRRQALDGLRLVPSKDAFEQQINYWAALEGERLPDPSQWPNIQEQQFLGTGG